MTKPLRKKLIEVALPLEAINIASAREKSIRHGHPSTLHLWWARRPLAAARAVIFSQMVDDPSEYVEELISPGTDSRRAAERALRKQLAAWEELSGEKQEANAKPTLEAVAIETERQRLFRIIEELVKWESTTNEEVLQKARDEIWRSWRRTCAENADHPQAKELFDRDKLPGFHDPFAGGGALPLEAQRLGLESYASDLNPVAVLINKAMIEIPPKFANQPPVNPGWRSERRGERNENALPRNSRLAKGDGGGERDVPASADAPEGGNVRDEIAADQSNRLGAREYRGGLDQRVGQGESPVLGNRPRFAGGSGDSVDALRTSGVVPSPGDDLAERTIGRSQSDAYGDAPKSTNLSLTPHSSALESPSSHSSALFSRNWKGAQGLSEDVRAYGKWMRDEAEKRIGQLYPKVKAVQVPGTNQWLNEEEIEKRKEELGFPKGVTRANLPPALSSHSYLITPKELTVIAWIWARTVKSPNPAFRDVDVPLASTFMLSTKPGKEAYVEPVIENGGYRFVVKLGKPMDADRAKRGTKSGGSGTSFLCLISGAPIPFDYIRTEAKAGKMGARLMAIVAEGDRGRVYVSPLPDQEEAASKAKPADPPDSNLPPKALGFRVQEYGMTKWGDLFTPRQLTALTTFSDLVSEARERVKADFLEASGEKRGEREEAADFTPHSAGLTSQAQAYADGVVVYLAMAIDRMANTLCSIARWTPERQQTVTAFARQAIPMTWDYPEVNPFAGAAGDYGVSVEGVIKGMTDATEPPGQAFALDAAKQSLSQGKLISTDPPYYDNIGYADLSDFFYVWLRRSLKDVYPELFATIAVPKAEELVATPYRHGGRDAAEKFFLDGMTEAMRRLCEQAHPAIPVTIYYAFKQSETTDTGGHASTGWETFLEAVIRSGFALTGTWPMRTELSNRMIGSGTNALASSIVLVCRRREAAAPTATRRELLNALQKELPAAVADLQRGNVAPVDMQQAAIGPGMAIFTRYSKVLDAEGRPLSVRDALAMINQALDEVLAEQEGDFDGDTRWALTWFEQFGFAEGDYGTAETLAVARNTSVQGVVEAGIAVSGKGRVRLLKPEELPDDWTPEDDKRLTVWDMVHHLSRTLAKGGEPEAAKLMAKLGTRAEVARELAYRLFSICDRTKRSQDALRYNELVQSWPEILRLSQSQNPVSASGTPNLFSEVTNE